MNLVASLFLSLYVLLRLSCAILILRRGNETCCWSCRRMLKGDCVRCMLQADRVRVLNSLCLVESVVFKTSSLSSQCVCIHVCVEFVMPTPATRDLTPQSGT